MNTLIKKISKVVILAMIVFMYGCEDIEKDYVLQGQEAHLFIVNSIEVEFNEFAEFDIRFLEHINAMLLKECNDQAFTTNEIAKLMQLQKEGDLKIQAVLVKLSTIEHRVNAEIFSEYWKMYINHRTSMYSYIKLDQ